ncbi:MAG: hypothetical protein EHM61_24030 [Acidobacteria bacterium]|nr:MAG: hypothetical protein EHM61_24030 [Acidobacteriota bacterium]
MRLDAAGDYASVPFISSDGRRVVFEKWTWDSDLYRLALDNGMKISGSPIRFLSSTRSDFDPAYSPDGLRIAFGSDQSGGSGIWVAEADGSNAREVFAREDWATYHPEWSPDGRQLVFAFKGPGEHDIYKTSAEGGTALRLTSDPIDELTPFWSRDSRWIYFSSAKTGRFEVWKIPAEGGEAVQVTHDGGFAPRESPAGDWLYYVASEREHATLWRTKTTRGEAEKVLPSVYRGCFSPVKDGVYFLTSVGAREFELRFIALKNGPITTLERMTAWSMGRLTVSPDQKSIVFRRVDDDVDVDIMMIENFR